MSAHKIPLAIRFSDKYTISDDGCWLWTANNNGRYGKMKINGKFISAHRVSYQLFNGPINDNLVLHKCDNSFCVNPEHLYLGTVSDNQKDRYRRSKRFYRGQDGRFISGV